VFASLQPRIIGAAERLLCHYNRLFQGDESRERTLIRVEHTPGIDRMDLRAHGPDVMVIPGVRKRRNWSTFEVAVERARPALIIEIVSPDARENDVVIKVEHYARAGVAQYVIVDDTGRGGVRRLRLLDYRLEGTAYRLQAPDADGRVHLASMAGHTARPRGVL
jgi:colicin import membrane protein